MSERERDKQSPNGRQDDSVAEGGILASLPRARPQRVSPRRAAARDKAAEASDASTAVKNAVKKKPTRARAAGPKKKPTAGKPRNAKPTEPLAPRQGYEPEEEVELGATVNPPSGTELVESVADILGEIANSGLSAGGKLLKDAFSLLRRA